MDNFAKLVARCIFYHMFQGYWTLAESARERTGGDVTRTAGMADKIWLPILCVAIGLKK